MHKHFPSLAAASLLLAPLCAARADNPVPLTTLTQQVLANNPAAKAAEARWRAARARIPQAAAWEDPEVGIEAETMRSGDVSRYSSTKVTLGRRIPFSGVNAARARAASAEAEALASDLSAKQLDLASQTATAYYRLAAARELLGINARTGSLATEAEKSSQSRYEAGTRPLSDVLAARTELARVEERQFEIEREIREQEAILLGLLDAPSGTRPPEPTSLEFRHFQRSATEMEALALDHRPAIATAKASIVAAREGETVAARSRIPDPMIAAAVRVYASNRDESEFTAEASFPLPWTNPAKYRAMRAEAAANTANAKHELDQRQAETRAEVRKMFAQLAAQEHHYMVYRDRVVPLAQQTVESVRAAYENGSAGFSDLNMARQRLQESEEERARQLAGFLETTANLESMAGILPGHDNHK